MDTEDQAEHWERVIRNMIARNTATAPTEPGVYRLPCGNCYVDFFLASDGTERWLVPGDERSYIPETVTVARHGDYPWERMYTLGRAAVEILRRVDEDDVEPAVVLEQLAAQVEAEEAAEEEEIAKILRERTAVGESTPLADIARSLGIDLDED